MIYEEEFTRDGDTWVRQTTAEPSPEAWPVRAALGLCQAFHVVDDNDALTIRFKTDDETAAYLMHVVGAIVDRDEAMALTLAGSGAERLLCALFRDRAILDAVMSDMLDLRPH